jgi:hypothetical protein
LFLGDEEGEGERGKEGRLPSWPLNPSWFEPWPRAEEVPEAPHAPPVTSAPNGHDSPKDVADKLTETYDINDTQGAQIEGYIADKGLGYVLEKVELADLEPQTLAVTSWRPYVTIGRSRRRVNHKPNQLDAKRRQ